MYRTCKGVAPCPYTLIYHGIYCKRLSTLQYNHSIIACCPWQWVILLIICYAMGITEFIPFATLSAVCSSGSRTLAFSSSCMLDHQLKDRDQLQTSSTYVLLWVHSCASSVYIIMVASTWQDRLDVWHSFAERTLYLQCIYVACESMCSGYYCIYSCTSMQLN